MKNTKLLLLVVGVFFIVALPISVSAVENSGVGGKPANPREDNIRTQSIFVHEIKPGDSVRDEVNVINNTTENKTIEIYPVDAQVSSGGAFACEQKADELNQEGIWIKMDKSQVELGPNGTENVGFSINVPSDASVGEHNACIAIQSIESSESNGTNGLQLSFRSAIRVAITVPGQLDKQLTFKLLTAEVEENNILVKQSLYNGGNVSLDTNLDTKIKTIFGNTIESKKGDYPILAGQTAEFNFEYERPWWGGFYRVVADATYNSDPNSSLGEKGQSTETLSKNQVIFVVPSLAALFAYILLIIAILYPIISYRRKKRTIISLRKKAHKHKVQKGEDISTIANTYHSDWKQIATINNLKQPYKLNEGDELFVVRGSSYQKKSKVTSAKKIAQKIKPKSSGKSKKPKS